MVRIGQKESNAGNDENSQSYPDEAAELAQPAMFFLVNDAVTNIPKERHITYIRTPSPDCGTEKVQNNEERFDVHAAVQCTMLK